jgi:hypothetical protein
MTIKYIQNLALLLSIFCFNVSAQDVYKWKDENGKIHFGDRSTAPTSGQKTEVKVLAPATVPVKHEEQAKQNEGVSNKTTTTARPQHSDPSKDSRPVDPSRVGPRCQGIVDQIAKVKPGTPWVGLANEFSQSCPGLTYECINSKSHPETNKCTWVEKVGNTILNTKNFE